MEKLSPSESSIPNDLKEFHQPSQNFLSQASISVNPENIVLESSPHIHQVIDNQAQNVHSYESNIIPSKSILCPQTPSNHSEQLLEAL